MKKLNQKLAFEVSNRTYGNAIGRTVRSGGQTCSLVADIQTEQQYASKASSPFPNPAAINTYTRDRNHRRLSRWGRSPTDESSSENRLVVRISLLGDLEKTVACTRRKPKCDRIARRGRAFEDLEAKEICLERTNELHAGKHTKGGALTQSKTKILVFRMTSGTTCSHA